MNVAAMKNEIFTLTLRPRTIPSTPIGRDANELLGAQQPLEFGIGETLATQDLASTNVRLCPSFCQEPVAHTHVNNVPFS
jgi:hypothetical protein